MSLLKTKVGRRVLEWRRPESYRISSYEKKNSLAKATGKQTTNGRDGMIKLRDGSLPKNTCKVT